MKLVADNFWTYLTSGKPDTLDPVLSYVQDGAWFSPAYKKGHWDGRVRFIKYDYATKLYRFPTGLLPDVVAFLESKDRRYQLEDNRLYEAVEPIFQLYDDKLGEITLRNYQQSAVQAALTHARGIVKVATAGGKTVIGAAIVRSIGRRTVWYVHRTNLLHQTRKVLAERLRQPIGIVGDSECELQEIVVSMVQTAAASVAGKGRPEFAEWLGGCEVIINDEAHHLGESQQQQAVAEATPATWRIGLSATPHLEGPGKALVGMCGPIICDFPASHLVEEGWITQPYVWFCRIDSEKQFPKKADWREVYRDGIVENKLRNDQVARVVSIFKTERRSILILVDQIKHGTRVLEALERNGLLAGWIHGKVSTVDRDKQIEELRKGNLDCVVAITETMGEGTDIPFLDVVINATGRQGGGNAKEGESGRRTIQILGRILRTANGKNRADYVDFMDTCHKSLLTASLSRVETLESEGYAKYIKYWTDYGLA